MRALLLHTLAGFLLLTSCRTSPPPPRDPIEIKRRQLRALEEMFQDPASLANKLVIGTAIHGVRQELQTEQTGGRPLPALDLSLPPGPEAGQEQFIAKGLSYQLRVLRWFEEVWVVWAQPPDRADVEEGIALCRRVHSDEMDALRRDRGSPYAYAPEHLSLFREAIDARQGASAAEKDPSRQQFLAASLAWWKERLAAAGK